MADKKLSYEAARDELAEIVESLEDGSASLEESLKLWAVSYTHLRAHETG
jgi:exodeoxyribonuclease VII small subunit